MDLNKIWHYKYKPTTIYDIVLDEKLKKRFESFKESGDISNLLLLGRAGIGKTTLSKIIVNDILQCQYIYINASDENGIDTIRGKVKNFSQTKGFDGNKKAIILDEADGVSRDGQRALRNVMEEYLDNVRFILTGNYSHKIIEPIKSRCQEYNLNFTLKDYAKRIFYILQKEGIEFDKDSVIKLIKFYYPDFRKCLNELEKLSINGKIDNYSLIDNKFLVDLWERIKNEESSKELRTFIFKNEDKFSNDYENLTEILFNFVMNLNLNEIEKSKILIELGDCLKNHSRVINPEINLFTSILRIKKDILG